MRIVRFERLAPEKGITYSRSKVRRLVREGNFPKPLPLDNRENHGTVGWLDSELDAWIASRAKLRDAAK